MPDYSEVIYLEAASKILAILRPLPIDEALATLGLARAQLSIQAAVSKRLRRDLTEENRAFNNGIGN